MLSLETEIAELSERVSRSVVRVECRGGGGSGVIWRADGLIITNAHVMQRPKATVKLWDGRQKKAQLCGFDAARDLAALRIDADELPAAQAGDERDLRVGQLVFALGNPHGSESSLTAGVVHAVGPLSGRRVQPWVQADITLHPGNSGGPLFDTWGTVIGINIMIVYGLALAVPASAVAEFVAPAQRRPMLGINCEPVTIVQRSVAQLDLISREGLLVVVVAENSAAARCGLLIGDIVTGVAGEDGIFKPPTLLERLLSNVKLGSGMTLEIVRAGKRECRDVVFDYPPGQHSEAA